MSMTSVPRLDLAPKLKRPLQPWNPLDYLRLLYWVFFFPQALRWYVETFADPKHQEATGRDLLPALREDPVQRNLALMGLLLILLTPLLLAVGLHR
ncbi:MAG: ATP-binding protein, partial [Clostridia bacterium]|nr:ATP-binding protein [Clostridia bacterium]